MLNVILDVAQQWGVICARSQRRGKPLGAMDGLFAATAQVGGLTPVTRNAADFASAGVDLVNPWTARLE